MGVVGLEFKKITLFTLAAICFIRFAPVSYSAIICAEEFQRLILSGEFGVAVENNYEEKYRKLTLLRNEATVMGRIPMNSFRSSLEYKYSKGFLQAVLREFEYVFDNSNNWSEIVINFNNVSMAYGRLGDLDDFDVNFDNREIQALRDLVISLQGSQDQQRDDEIEEYDPEDEEEENDENMQ